MIQSPWEQATALVTTEREGVRTHRQFALTSTQQSIDIPIAEDAIPNIYVSVLLVKGRSNRHRKRAAARSRTTRKTIPAIRASRRSGSATCSSRVEDTSKRLTVAVAANKEEYRPANTATVTLDVKDRQGRGTASEVTLWAVDYGVLSLTGFRTPDVLDSVYVKKALQVLTEDTRQKIISRRVITPKGDTDGGGGGVGRGRQLACAQDFRVLAFWIGSVTTDARGHATVDVKLPESLTTYRIMAVAGDKSSRFGSADSEIRINKPVTLKADVPAVPRGRRQGVVRRGRHQPAEDRRAGDRDDREPRSRRDAVCRRPTPQTVDVRGRRIGGGPLRRRGPDDRPRAREDDRQAGQRDRRVPGRHSGRSAGLAGDRLGDWRSGRLDADRRGAPETAGGRRDDVRRAARRSRVHGAGRPRRRRAVSRRVSVRLRRAARLARAGAAAVGRSRRSVQAAGHRAGAVARDGAVRAEGARALPVRQTAASPTGPASAGARRRT